MKALLKNVEKRDVQFILALAVFTFLIACRCLGELANVNPIPFGTLIDSTKKSCATIMYLGSFFLFYFVAILKTEKEKKKDMYYLITFLSIFVLPMFLAVSYFGNKEILAWILVIFSVIFILFEKAEWISIPAVALMTILCPISVFCCVCCIIALLLYQYFAKNKIKYFLYAVANFILAALLFLFQYYTAKEFDTEARFDLTLTKFIVTAVLMSPYLLIAFSFFRGWLNRVSGTKKKFGCIAIILGILPSIIVDIYIEDYSKAFFHVFVYFILVVMSLLVMKEENVVFSFDETKEKIKEWVPIPSVVLIYPFIFMIMWICGFQKMPEETVIGFQNLILWEATCV